MQHIQTPLHFAVNTFQREVVQCLLAANANPLLCDINGKTPLHLACSVGFMEGAMALLNRTHHTKTEGCRIPEINLMDSNGQWLLLRN